MPRREYDTVRADDADEVKEIQDETDNACCLDINVDD
jgi:hypothetical protein